MSLPTLQQMVDANPDLYEALRRRDSAANLVCETMQIRGTDCQKEFELWKKEKRNVVRQVSIAAHKLGVQV